MADMAAIGSHQRVFRARQKLNEPGFISHITQRAAGREPLFIEDDDFLRMLSLLKESSDKYALSFYAFCLMPNHIHMLIKPEERNLIEAMRSLFSRYAAQFNRKYARRGHLFGGPYRQAVCLDSTYLLTASVYIHLNPVRAGLADRAQDYRWSSCRLYTGNVARESFVDTSTLFELLNEDPGEAKGYYSRILNGACGAEPENALEQEGAIESFCHRLAGLFPDLFRRARGKNGDFPAGGQEMMELTDLDSMIQHYRENASRSPESRKARAYLIDQLRARGYTQSEIALRLGVSRKTVYSTLKAGRT